MTTELTNRQPASALLMSGDAMNRIERIAGLMASGKTTVPAHLRGSLGDCFAIALQAAQWGMNPFAVAQKTHLVNGTLGYEAQLVAAVINSSGTVKDRFSFDFFGPWEKVIGKFIVKKGEKGEYRQPGWTFADEDGCGVRVSATLKGESAPRVLELLLAQARVRNSTLWADDPKQQLAYLGQKKWSRLYAPDVILGVYTADELADPVEKDMGAAVVVESAPAVKPPRHVWNTADWAAILPKILAGIEKGKTIADALAWLNAKAEVTPEQADELRELAEAQAQTADEPPGLTYEIVAEKINGATNLDALAEAADLIGAIGDVGAREALRELYEQKTDTLEAL